MLNQLLGKFDPQKITVSQSGNLYNPPSELALKIDILWDKAKEQFKDKVWDGVNYRLDGVVHTDDATELVFGLSAYKNNYASRRLADDIIRLPYEERPNCLYISTLLQTTDNKFVLGKTAALGSHGSTVALLGGSLNHDEMEIHSGGDLERYLYKELYEELCITENYIDFSEGLGIYEMPSCRIGIFLHTVLSISSSEFENVVRINDEHDGYLIVREEEIQDELSKENSIFNRGVFLAVSQFKLQ